MTIKNAESKSNSVKLLRKAFNKYPKDVQKQMKKDYALIIRDIRQPKNCQETYKCYVPVIEELSPKDRTILYYGVSIRLSQKQFASLYLALIEGVVEDIAYTELQFSSKKPAEKNYESNLKSFVSKLHNKILEQITKQKSEYFSGKSEKFIKKAVKSLIFYKKDYMNTYALHSNFTVFKLSKTANKIERKEHSMQFI